MAGEAELSPWTTGATSRGRSWLAPPKPPAIRALGEIKQISSVLQGGFQEREEDSPTDPGGKDGGKVEVNGLVGVSLEDAAEINEVLDGGGIDLERRCVR